MQKVVETKFCPRNIVVAVDVVVVVVFFWKTGHVTP